MRSSPNARTHKKLLVPLDLNHCTTAICCWPVSAGQWPLADLAIHGSVLSMSYSPVSHRTVILALRRLVSDLVQNLSALRASMLGSLSSPPGTTSKSLGYICVRVRSLACIFLVATEHAIPLTRACLQVMTEGTIIGPRGLLTDTNSPAVSPQTSLLSFLSNAPFGRCSG